MKLLLSILISFTFNLVYSQSYPQKIDVENQIREYNGYTVSYNETHEQSNWVYYILKPSDLEGESVKVYTKFSEDDSISTKTAEYSDYTNSGYDRGHLKPAGDEVSDSLQKRETYYMSNVSPQEPSFNRGVWLRLENHVRRITMDSDSVIVITGPILSDSLAKIGKDNKVSVPEYFFKIIHVYVNGNMNTFSYLLRNEKSDAELDTFMVSIEVIENITRLEF